MDKINVEIIGSNNLKPLDIAVSKPYGSKIDHYITKNVVCKNKHLSCIEHAVLSFEIDGISRGCLQELVRHRIASYTVASTRFRLRKLLNVFDISEIFVTNLILDDGSVYEVDPRVYDSFIAIYRYKKVPSDIIKYNLPEGFRTSLVMTINARSLINFFTLRMATNAHFEIRYLAKLMLKKIAEFDSRLYEYIIENLP